MLERSLEVHYVGHVALKCFTVREGKKMATVSKDCEIREATTDDAPHVAVMVGELLNEIMLSINAPVFTFDLGRTTARLKNFIAFEKNFVFVAHGTKKRFLGFAALYESHALYADGSFGTISELYVRPEHRSQAVGLSLLSEARTLAILRKRLEVTTPPLPQFERTLRFYEREGFEITGGRKLRVLI